MMGEGEEGEDGDRSEGDKKKKKKSMKGTGSLDIVGFFVFFFASNQQL